jgi:hypothetical protein
MKPDSRIRPFLLNAAIVLMSVAATLFLLEIGVRVYDHEYRWVNFLGEERTLFKSAYPTDFDPDLGWIPKRGVTVTENVWGKRVTILENGLRSNGGSGTTEPKPAGPGPILAVGDSFTFGDEVADDETWPALLEKIVKRRVINAGVFGYGLDQSFLRAMKLAGIYRPETLIFSFITDDIGRCELSARSGAQKPFFVIHNGHLALKNMPVPRPSHSAHQRSLRPVLGYSYLAHKLMMKCCPHYWLMGVTWKTFYSQHRVHTDGDAVACGIFRELEKLADRSSIRRVYILIQYEKKPKPYVYGLVDGLKRSCMVGERITVVDSRPVLEGIREEHPEQYDRLFDRHMTREGNALVAEIMAGAMAASRPEAPTAGSPSGEATTPKPKETG